MKWEQKLTPSHKISAQQKTQVCSGVYIVFKLLLLLLLCIDFHILVSACYLNFACKAFAASCLIKKCL